MRRAAASIAVALACAPATEHAEGGASPASHTGPAVDAGPWRRVLDRESLVAALREAGTTPVVIDVGATWCAPCLDLERNTLADARVLAALRDHALVRVDVSAGTPAQEGMQAFFDALSLPRLLVFDDASALREALMASAPQAPRARVVVKTYVDADELLALLGAAAPTP